MWTVWPLLGSNGLNGRIPPGEARAPKPESPVLLAAPSTGAVQGTDLPHLRVVPSILLIRANT